jgi:4-hydroxy-tetrahydrodipicolinate synthase
MPDFVRKPLEGLLPLMPLPIDHRQGIDYEGIKWNIDLVAEAGAPGFIMFGSMGQMSNVSEAEYDRVCDVAVEAGDDRDLTVVIGTTAQSQQEAIRRTVYAEQAGADGAMLATPYVLPLTRPWIVNFYHDVAESLDGELAIMVYNYQPLTGVNITADLWRDHLLNIPALKAIKESNAALPHYDDVLLTIADRVNFFSAPEPAFLHASTLGAAGVTGIFCWAGLKVAVRYVQECRKGNQRDPWVMEAYKAFQEASAAMRRPDMPLMLSYEHGYLNAVAEFGRGRAGHPRKPYEPLPEPAVRVMHSAMQRLAELEEDL